MARKIVTILTRRGNSADFDESQMLAGEIATAEDTEQAYISFSDGTAEELAFKRDLDNVSADITIDSALSVTSENPVQNKVITAKINELEQAIGDSSEGDSSESSVFTGRTASFFGDSLTEVNYHYTKGYHEWCSDILGLASYNNYGKSGNKVSDVYNKVNSVTDTADIVFVMCGVNDQTYDVPLGTMEDNTASTTYGALNLLCASLKQKYPTSIIVFITPHYQTKYPHGEGITSYEISKAVREVCGKYAIPVFDNFILSGIYSTNLAVFTTDNCHWNDIGHEMVGKNLASFMLSTFRYVYGEASVPDDPESPDVPDEPTLPEFTAKTVKITGVKNTGKWHLSLYATAAELPAVSGTVEFGVKITPISSFTPSANSTGGFYYVDIINDLLAGYGRGGDNKTPSVTNNGDGTFSVIQTHSGVSNITNTKNFWCLPMYMTMGVGAEFTVSDAYIKVNDEYYSVHAVGGAFEEETATITDV